MAPATLLSLANSEFRGHVVDRLANVIGEDPSVTQAALGGAIPALIMGLVQKASTNQGATDLFQLLQKLHLDGTSPLNTFNALAGTEGVSHLMETGGPLVLSLLAGKVGTITQWVSAQTGMRTGSAAALLSLAAPIVMSLVGRQVRTSGNTWSVSGLRGLVSDQNITVPKAPAGPPNAVAHDRDQARATLASSLTAGRRATVHGGAWAWWQWFVPLLLLSAGFLALLRKPAQTADISEGPATTLVKPSELGTSVPTLPNGARLNVEENGVESHLIHYLAAGEDPVNTHTWFTLDQVEFEPVSATLTAGSEEQLRNLAEILEAYPRVNLTIGGFTDNVGDPAQNKALSAQRATSVRNALVRMGVAPARLSAEGFGEKRPASDNATEAGRERNWRIAINVTRR